MDPVHLFLSNVWFGILGLLLVLYVVLDGFTLGVGIISLFQRKEAHREVMSKSLSGVWDANESWLVVFAGALFGAFPPVYGLVLHSLYIPVMLMVVALIFRSIAFEFRSHGRHKQRWNLAFGLGSLGTAVTQGMALGAVLSGIPAQGGVFTGSIWGWFSPFAAVTALGVLFGYILLGAGYLIVKTEGELQDQAYRVARWSGWLMMAAGAAVSAWTPLRFAYVEERWFSWPNIAYLAPLPLSAGGAFFMLLRALRRRYLLSPLMWSVAIFLASFGGLAASIYPYMLPGALTIMESSAAGITLVFMLAGIGFLIPVMLVYNAYQYLVFRGKVSVRSKGYR